MVERTAKSFIPQWLTQHGFQGGAVLTLMLAGIFGNLASVPLFFGVDLIFGSIASLMLAILFGPLWGAAGAAAASLNTIFLWGHPYAAVSFILEASLVGIFRKRLRGNIVLLDAVYWILIGVPLAWFFYSGPLKMNAGTVQLIMLKQMVNGLFNAMIANLALFLLVAGRGFFRQNWQLRPDMRQLLFGVLSLCCMLPTMVIMGVRGYREFTAIEESLVGRIQGELTTSRALVEELLRTHRHAVAELAGEAGRIGWNRADELQRITGLMARAFPRFHNLYIADAAATAIAFYPAVNARGEPTRGLNFADRPYAGKLRQTMQPVISDVFQGRGGVDVPIVVIGVPVLERGRYAGFASGAMRLEEISRQLKFALRSGITGVLLDRRQLIVAGTKAGTVSMTEYREFQGGERRLIQPGIIQWLPGGLPEMERWRHSFYLAEGTVAGSDGWRLLVAVPVAPFRDKLFEGYIERMMLMLGVTLISIGIAYLLSRSLTIPLVRLAAVTTGLPEKLERQETVMLPDSPVQEIGSLIGNYRVMASALRDQFQFLNDANQRLEQTVERRTADLQESERRYRLLAENATDLIARYDLTGNFLYVSPSCRELLGYDPEELTGRGGLEIIHPEDQAAVRESLRRILAEPVTDTISWRALRKNGEYRWVETTSKVVRDPVNGEAGEIVAITRDITARKKVEDLLRLDSERVQALLQLNQMTAAPVKDITGFALEAAVRLTGSRIGFLAFANEDETVLEMHGWSRQAMAECAMTDKPSRFNVAETGLWGEVIRQRRPVIVNDYAGDNPLKKGVPEGHVPVTRYLSVPVFSGSRVVLVAGVGNKDEKYGEEDVGRLTLLMEGMWSLLERRQVQNALRESEDRFRTLFANMTEGVALHELVRDESGKPVNYRLLDVNPAFERQTGLLAVSVRGQLATDVYGTVEAPYLARFGAVAETGQPLVFETYFPPLDRHFQVSVISPRRDSFATVFEDITFRVRREDALRQKTEEMERFSYTVSHDLKSPLVTIRSFLGYLEEDMQKADPVKIQQDLEYMRNAAEKMSRLLDELLGLSRIGRRINPPVEAALQELAAEAQALVAGRIASRGVKVDVTSQPVILFGDRPRLVEIFQNLLDNAVKFMGAQQEPRIVISARKMEEETVISIQDNGQGIDPRHHKKLFGLFEKLHAGTEGTGIGLALVKRIVEVHDGRIWVESAGEGQGTTFHFTLARTRWNQPREDN